MKNKKQRILDSNLRGFERRWLSNYNNTELKDDIHKYKIKLLMKRNANSGIIT